MSAPTISSSGSDQKSRQASNDNNNSTHHDNIAKKNTRKRPLPNWRDVAAGASAGAFSRTVTAPIERIKLILQLQHSLVDHSKTAASSQQNKSALEVAKSIYKREGLLSFWRGNLPSVLRVSGTASINFTMMNYYKEAAVGPTLKQLQEKYPVLFQNIIFNKSGTAITGSPEQLERRLKNMTSLVSGGMAGGTATTLLYPIEFLRTRLAADVARGNQHQQQPQQQNVERSKPKYQFQGMRHAFTTIVRSDGIRGLFQGYGIALFGGIFYRVLFLGGYDVLKSETERSNQQQGNNGTHYDISSSCNGSSSLSWGQRIGIAQAVSLTAGTISYPLDSVRRRLMMQAGKPHTERVYRNSIHCIQQVFANEGIRGFFLGIGPNILRSVSGALLLVAYDVFKGAM